VNIGHVCAVAAFLLWGLLPIYWKQLEGIPSLQLVAHRVVWSSLTLLPLIWWSGGWGQLRLQAARPGVLLRQGLAAVLVAANWLGFVWAVTHGRMIESSLGYFLTPLVSVLLGVALLGERLRPGQWLAVAVAAVGVAWIAAGHQHVPWIALFLAGTFSSYALVKKTTALGALPSLALETFLLLVPALAYLGFAHATGRGRFGHVGPGADLLMALSGVATATPLLCFATAARRIPLATLGLLQYLGPTLQFLLGLGLYREPFDRGRFVGFAIVWGALALYAFASLRRPSAVAAGPGRPADEGPLPTGGNVAEPAGGNFAEPAGGNVAEPAGGNVVGTVERNERDHAVEAPRGEETAVGADCQGHQR
jgi:chloramphenicol-sensitive protein RarD